MIYSLSAAGRIAAEKIGYEKSPLAMRRKFAAAAAASVEEAAKAGLGKIAAWLGTGVTTAVAASWNWHALARCSRQAFGGKR